MDFSLDITSRREAEFEIERLRASLARATRMSTLGELATAIAHELNQPLAAIQANTGAAIQLLRTGKAGQEELLEILGDIAADDLRAGAIIARMREPIRRNAFTFQPLHLNRLIGELVKSVRRNASLLETSLELDLDQELPPLLGDKIQLQQVFMNLLLNAFDAVREVVPALRRIAISTRQEPGCQRVEVRDSGPGIPQASLGQVFDPFFTTRPQGLGLGLPICRALLEAHGGTIQVDTPAGGGARFTVLLPDRPQPSAEPT